MIIEILDLKYIPSKRTGYALNPGINELTDKKTLELILPDIVRVPITIDGIRSNSNLKKTLIFTEKSLFYTIFGHTQPHSYPLDDIDGFYQLIAGSYKSEKPINITGIEKIHLKYVCIQGSIVNGTREPLFYSFALDLPPERQT